jgi:hypothetical protein
MIFGLQMIMKMGRRRDAALGLALGLVFCGSALAAELTPADLEHGRKPVQQMLGDRPGMAVYHKEKDEALGYVGGADAIYRWAVEAYAGKHVGERVFWDGRAPQEGLSASHTRPGLHGLYLLRVSDERHRGKKAFDLMWAAFVCEMLSVSQKEAWTALDARAKQGEITAEEYVKACARVEWLTFGKMPEMRRTLWQPWADKVGHKTELAEWEGKHLGDFDAWLALFAKVGEYPKVPYLKLYELARGGGGVGNAE